MDTALRTMNNKVSVPDQIIRLIRTRGYILPADITRELKINTLFAGAHLSEMAEKGKLRISHTKVGSSPAYYLPETVSSLERLEKYLNEKDRKTFQLLQERKVLRDRDLGPLMQVSLRNIRDFAVPLRVNKEEIFWKYFLVSDEEATKMIKEIIDADKKDKETSDPAPEIKKEEGQVKKEEKRVSAEAPAQSSVQQEAGKTAAVAEKPDTRQIQKKKPQQKKTPAKERSKGIEQKKDRAGPEKTGRKEEKQTTIEDKAPEIRNEFYDKISSYCSRKKIKILEAELIKKNDIELMLEVPTVIGNVRYFAKARDKKRSNDGDLSSAYVRGQTKSLPTLYITTGKITKKALDMVGKDFKQMIVKEID